MNLRNLQSIVSLETFNILKLKQMNQSGNSFQNLNVIVIKCNCLSILEEILVYRNKVPLLVSVLQREP